MTGGKSPRHDIVQAADPRGSFGPAGGFWFSFVRNGAPHKSPKSGYRIAGDVCSPRGAHFDFRVPDPPRLLAVARVVSWYCRAPHAAHGGSERSLRGLDRTID